MGGGMAMAWYAALLYYGEDGGWMGREHLAEQDTAPPSRHHLPVPQCAGRANRGISYLTVG
jgi:hypothetical protein